jgi:hypothetical protein
LQKLSAIEKKGAVYHYLTPLATTLGTLKTKIKKHKNTYDNLMFKVEKGNVLDCLKELYSLYEGTKHHELLVTKDSKDTILFIRRKDEVPEQT